MTIMTQEEFDHLYYADDPEAIFRQMTDADLEDAEGELEERRLDAWQRFKYELEEDCDLFLQILQDEWERRGTNG